TVPDSSCPGINGSRTAKSPFAPWSKWCRSEPQIPTWCTRTLSWSGPGSGTSTVRTSACAAPSMKSARAVVAVISHHRRHSAVDEEVLSGDEPGGAGAAEQQGSGELLQRAPPLCRGARGQPGAEGSVLHQGPVHVRGEVSRRDRVHLDVVPGEVCGHALGQLRDGSLGGGVRGDRLPRQRGLDGAEVDDLARTATDQRRDEVPGDVEDAVEVHVDDLVPVLRCELLQRCSALQAGI